MKTPELTPRERETLLIEGVQQMLTGELSEGQLLAQLRRRVLGMSQTEYAAFVGVSRRTLSSIENDAGRQSTQVIDTVFKPFSLRLGLLPTSLAVLTQAVESLPQGGSVGPTQRQGFKRRGRSGRSI